MIRVNGGREERINSQAKNAFFTSGIVRKFINFFKFVEDKIFINVDKVFDVIIF